VFAVDVDRPLASGVTQIANTAEIADDGSGGADPNPGDNLSSDDTPIDFPDLQILKDDGNTTVAAGGTIVYALDFTNTGNADATGVVITDTVPANTTFNPGASTPGWLCAPDNSAGSTCTLGVGTVSGGGGFGQVLFAVDVDRPLASGVTQISNAAEIADDGSGGADPNPGDNLSSDDTPIEFPDLQIVKNDGDTTVAAGGSIAYTLDFTNVGNADATGVVITETVPVNTTFNPSASTTGWLCAPDHSAGSTCTLAVGTVAGGYGSGQLVFAVFVNSPLASGVTQIANTAEIADDGSGGADPNPGDNSSTDFTPVVNSRPVINNDLPSVGVDEGLTAENSGTVTDADGDDVTLTASAGAVINLGNGTWYWTYATTDGPEQSQFVTITADDGHGQGGIAEITFDLTVWNLAPQVGSISVQPALLPIGTEVNASAGFVDAGVDDTHTALWDWGDGSTSIGDVVETGGSGTVTGSHTYITPGEYTLQLTVSDDNGDSGYSFYQYIVVLGPGEGFVSGGGWIHSPAGSYIAEPQLSGRASFRFVSMYRKGALIPTGQAEFQLREADLNFHSESYQWLGITDARASLIGSGTINGGGNYGFMLTAIDAKLSPNTDVDLFRFRIWDLDNNYVVVYDSQMGDDALADPTTALGGGSIVVHKAK
jgi:uncharacterized repeat protein (TIGR01451 family)